MNLFERCKALCYGRLLGFQIVAKIVGVVDGWDGTWNGCTRAKVGSGLAFYWGSTICLCMQIINCILLLLNL